VIAARATTAVLTLLGLALFGALGVVLGRIAALEARELDARGDVFSLAELADRQVVLVEAELERGEDAVFELCAGDAMGDSWGESVRVEIRAGADLAMASLLDSAARARARTNPSGACLELGRGTLEASGRYTVVIRARTPLPSTNVRGRIVARRPLGPFERNGVLALLSLALLFVVFLAVRAPEPSGERRARWLRALRARARRLARRRPLASPLALVAFGAALVVVVGMATPRLLPPGSTYGLVAGLSLALVEILLAWALLGGATARLRLVRPSATWLTVVFFVAAPMVGFFLHGFALWALSNVEATGEAPIEAFVSWPSGLLSFGALAVIAPIAEEVFFRGFVFGAIDDGKWGSARAVAFTLAWGLFAIAHLHQAWGNWGGLLAVTTAGFVFTLLRMLSGSTLVPALAHLVYNALLSISALTSAAGALAV
jgi:membrane protease YdiL (CAAX protease family)